jgi:DNA-directed RNA polymerase specialized sigma24 family protein
MSPRAAARKAVSQAETRADSPEDAVPLLRGLLMLTLEQREGALEADRPSTQLLADAGLDYRQIAELLGKSPDAVRMALTRAKKTPAKKTAAKKTDAKKSSN